MKTTQRFILLALLVLSLVLTTGCDAILVVLVSMGVAEVGLQTTHPPSEETSDMIVVKVVSDKGDPIEGAIVGVYEPYYYPFATRTPEFRVIPGVLVARWRTQELGQICRSLDCHKEYVLRVIELPKEWEGAEVNPPHRILKLNCEGHWIYRYKFTVRRRR